MNSFAGIVSPHDGGKPGAMTSRVASGDNSRGLNLMPRHEDLSSSLPFGIGPRDYISRCRAGLLHHKYSASTVAHPSLTGLTKTDGGRFQGGSRRFSFCLSQDCRPANGAYYAQVDNVARVVAHDQEIGVVHEQAVVGFVQDCVQVGQANV